MIESLVSVVYWFPFYYTFKFVFLLWLSLPTFKYVTCLLRSLCSPFHPRLTEFHRGADVVFHSLIVPVFGKYFSAPAGSTAGGLRAKADSLYTE